MLSLKKEKLGTLILIQRELNIGLLFCKQVGALPSKSVAKYLGKIGLLP